MPDRAVACGYDCTTGFCLSQLKEGRYKVFIELRDGGYGGSARGDGCDAVAGPLSNCTNTPVEQIDADYAFFRIERYALRPGSGGAGMFRGGLGSIRSYRILDDGIRLAIYADRFRTPASGRRWRLRRPGPARPGRHRHRSRRRVGPGAPASSGTNSSPGRGPPASSGRSDRPVLASRVSEIGWDDGFFECGLQDNLDAKDGVDLSRFMAAIVENR